MVPIKRKAIRKPKRTAIRSKLSLFLEDAKLEAKAVDTYRRSVVLTSPDRRQKRKDLILYIARILGPKAPIMDVLKKAKVGWGAFFKYRKDPVFDKKIKQLMRSSTDPKKKKISINWKQFDYLCRLQCSAIEIAGFFDCSADFIYDVVKRDWGMSFPEYHKLRSSSGKISLRRSQWKSSRTNVPMQIFLGKNYLHQSDIAVASPSEFESDKFDEQLDKAIKKLGWSNAKTKTVV